MKRFLALVCALTAAACLAQTSGNLIGSPGLEGVQVAVLPEGWVLFSQPEGGFKSSVAEGGRTGARSLVTSGAGEYGGVAVPRIALEADKQYALRGWTRIEGEGTAAATIKFDYFKPDGSYLDSEIVGQIKPATPGWQPVVVLSREKAPEGATHIGAGLALNGQGKAWFDDLELVSRPAPAPGNLAINGEMERLFGSQMFGYYVGSSEGGQVKGEPSAEEPKDGWHCLRLHGKAEWAIAATPRVPIVAGKSYTLTGYARAKQGTAQIKIDYFKGEEYLGQTASNDVTENQWTFRRVFSELEQHPGATHLAATAVGLGEVDASFDGLVLIAK